MHGEPFQIEVPAYGAARQVEVCVVESVEYGNARLNREVLAEFPGIAQFEIEGLEPSQPLLALRGQRNLRQISAMPQLLNREQAIVDKRLSSRCQTAGHAAVVIGQEAVQISRLDLASKGADRGAGKRIAVGINGAAIA